jgi:hypothetical protein
VDHVIAPLDRAVPGSSPSSPWTTAALAIDREAAVPAHPHITLASFADLTAADATIALAPAVAATALFVVRAHGYGMFAGDDDVDLSLHVMVYAPERSTGSPTPCAPRSPGPAPGAVPAAATSDAFAAADRRIRRDRRITVVGRVRRDLRPCRAGRAGPTMAP